MKHSLPIMALLALSGCSTTYYNPNISDPAALEQQRAVDEGYCTRVAAGSVPMPDIRHYQSGVQNYQVNGQIRSYGSNGISNSNYTGNVTSYQNTGDAFSSGMANGISIGAAFQASRASEKVMQCCIYSLGWTTDKNSLAQQTTSPQISEGSQKERLFALALKGASEGDLQLQIKVGNAYMDGTDVPIDFDKAIYWLNKASEQGSSEANFRLSYIYAGYLNTKYTNFPKMSFFLQTAADQGEAAAQNSLASMYLYGAKGYSKNLSKSAQWFTKSCEQNDGLGCLAMGHFYSQAMGVKKDLVRAHKFYAKAEKFGQKDAIKFIDIIEKEMTKAQLKKVLID